MNLDDDDDDDDEVCKIAKNAYEKGEGLYRKAGIISSTRDSFSHFRRYVKQSVSLQETECQYKLMKAQIVNLETFNTTNVKYRILKRY
jgi:hypothetical protein